jgi:hypothetical protein
LPAWANQGPGHSPSRVVEDIEVWRAAMGVNPDDQRPTGSVQQHKMARMWQRQLDEAMGGSLSPAWQEWAPLIGQIAPSVRRDGFAPILAGRLAAISRSGVNATQLLRTAVIGKPLPDEHAAAALWWRICRPFPRPYPPRPIATPPHQPLGIEACRDRRYRACRSPSGQPLVAGADHSS